MMGTAINLPVVKWQRILNTPQIASAALTLREHARKGCWQDFRFLPTSKHGMMYFSERAFDTVPICVESWHAYSVIQIWNGSKRFESVDRPAWPVGMVWPGLWERLFWSPTSLKGVKFMNDSKSTNVFGCFWMLWKVRTIYTAPNRTGCTWPPALLDWCDYYKNNVDKQK